MVVETRFGPYAPKKAVVGVISRYRERNIPDLLTIGSVQQIGVPSSMAHRTLQALRFLGLIDENGGRTPAFERLKRATSEEYQDELAEIVRAAYLPVFTIVNPGEDSDVAINDAFRQFEPSTQREKMIALFRGLCDEAGITQPATRRPKPQVTNGRVRTDPLRVNRPLRSQDARRNSDDQPSRPENLPQHAAGFDYQVISAIIQQLPRDARWTAERRDRWLQAMTAAIDLLIELDDGTSNQMNFMSDDRSRSEELEGDSGP